MNGYFQGRSSRKTSWMALRDPALVEGDDPEAADEPAGRPELGRILGQDEVAPRAVPAQDLGQDPGRVGIGLQGWAELGDLRPHRVARVGDGAGHVCRGRSEGPLGQVQGLDGLVDAGLRGGHQLDEPGQRGAAGGVRARAIRGGPLGLADRDVLVGDREPIRGGGAEIAARGDHRVGTADRIPGGRERSGQTHERVAREHAPQVLQADPPSIVCPESDRAWRRFQRLALAVCRPPSRGVSVLSARASSRAGR